MAEQYVQRRLAAILATDVVGYSRLMEADEAGTLDRLKALRRELFEPKTKQYRGRIFKTTGDGALVEFRSAVDAVNSAVDIQRALAEREERVSKDRRIRLRIGVSLGDVIVEGSDLYGNGVNVAARMESLAEPGGICISGNVHEHVRGATALRFNDFGEQQVKNIDTPIRTYSVTAERIERPASDDGKPLSLPDKPSIAVLPFQDMSAGADQEHFSDGISEDIITALSRVRWLFVTARNSSFSYKGQSHDVRRVALDLGVRYVLEGSVRRVANRVRITAQLVDGGTGNHIWADRYDRDLEDIFAVQDEITQVVVGTIEPALARAEQERASVKAPANLDAWETYQRGMWHAQLHRNAELKTAEALLVRAIEMDPNLVSAYAALSEILGRRAISDSEAPERVLERAVAAGRRAVELDPSDAGARCALGRAYFFVREPDNAIAELRKAIDINPSYAHAHYSIGATLTHSGRSASAIPHLEMARRLSPRDYLLGAMMARQAEAYLFMGNYERAAEWGSRAIHEDRTWYYNHLAFVSALGHLGRLDEAQRACADLLTVKDDISVSFVRRRLPFMDASDMETMLDGLRKAELPAGDDC